MSMKSRALAATRSRAALIAVAGVVALFAACGGSSKGAAAPAAAWECLAGNWNLQATVVRVDFGVASATGLERAPAAMRLLDPAITEGVTVLEIDTPAKPEPDGDLFAVVLPALAGGGEWLTIGGIYYAPSADVTVDLSFGTEVGTEYGDEYACDCEAFTTFAGFTLYAGDVIEEVETEPGIFSWQPRADAEVVASGVLRITGSR